MRRPAKNKTSARRTQGVLGGRSDQIVRRALNAAIAELACAGYAELRIDKVASRAKVNKTTIYRRWPNRVELVTAVVDQMKTSLRENPLPNTGEIERDLIEVFTRRFTFGRKVEGQAWARLLNERHNPEVEAIIKEAVDERRNEWRLIVARGIARGELPPGTNTQLLFDFVRAIVDARKPSQQMDTPLLTIAVQTVLAGARAGILVQDPAWVSCAAQEAAPVVGVDNAQNQKS